MMVRSLRGLVLIPVALVADAFQTTRQKQLWMRLRVSSPTAVGRYQRTPVPFVPTVRQHASVFRAVDMNEVMSDDQLRLGLWMLSFATSHIGMSAVRTRLIAIAGHLAQSGGLVGNASWKLPDVWPGDATGGAQIMPDVETAGRQFYRFGYTIVSFITLGTAARLYLESLAVSSNVSVYLSSQNDVSPWFLVAATSTAASLSSLANASPLGLMPGFQPVEHHNSTQRLVPSLERQDNLKFQVRGLTRLTRHPLILPVVPWGIAHAHLLGGRTEDWLFFGGLALYAVAGCAAQDLRVSRQEGSVGTVFGDNNDDALQAFFRETSFVPFGAVLDGRQPLERVLPEIPWLAVVPACVVAVAGEAKLIDWIGSYH